MTAKEEAEKILQGTCHPYTAAEAQNDAKRRKDVCKQFWDKQSQVKKQAQRGNYELWVPYLDRSVQEAFRSLGFTVNTQGKGYSIGWKDMPVLTGDCGSRDSP